MRKYASSPWFAFAAVAFAIALAYGNAIPNGFVFDDYDLVVDNAQIRSLEQIPSVLGFGDSRTRYRPVRFISYSIDHALFGLDPRGFHFSNLVYHTLCAFLVYLIATRLSGAHRVGLLAALLFAVHPVNTDAVSYIAGRRDILSTLFYLLGFLAYVRYRDDGRVAWLGVLLSAFVLGLFTKEMVVTLPLMLLAYDYHTGALRESLRRHAWLYGCVFLLAVVFLFETLVVNNPSMREGLYGASWLLHFLTIARVFATYIGLLGFPLTLNADYSYNTFPVTESPLEPAALAAVVLHIVLLGLCLRAWRTHRLFAFGVLWFYVALIPVAQIVPHHELMAEHYLYLPSVGFCLVVAFGLEAWLSSGRARPVAYAAAGVLLALFAARTTIRNLDWRDDVTLWEATVATAPDNARAHKNLATAYARHGDTERAVRHFRQSLTITPDNARVIFQLGQTYHAAGQLDDALRHYHSAIERQGDLGPAYFGIGQIHALQGQFDAALRALAAAARLQPRDARSQHELGTAYYRIGRFDEARVQYLRTLAIDPDYVAGFRNLAIVESMLGNAAAADEAYREFVSRTPADGEGHRELARLLVEVAGEAREVRSADAPG